MAKKRRKKKGESTGLPVELKREIAAVLLAAAAVLLTFAVFNFGGSFVTGVFLFWRVALGYGAYLLPILCGLLAFMLFQHERYQTKWLNYIGFVVIILAFSGLCHIGIAADIAQVEAQAGRGGGYVGMFEAAFLLPLLNVTASAVVLAAVLVIGLIVGTGAPISQLMKAIWTAITQRREKGFGDDIDISTPIEQPDIKVNDNSGTSLPVKGELNVGAAKKTPVPDVPKEAMTLAEDKDWVGPDLSLLNEFSTKADAGNVKENAGIIKQTMDSFGINVTMGEVNVGPTVTQYTFLPPAGVKLNKITGLDTNLALSLAAHPIRIEAPIPGKSAVGVEIPNKTIATVRLRSVLEAPEWGKAETPLTFVLGRDVSGTPMFTDLAKMPHMLIAGATGSGKSAMINAFLTSLLYRNSPNELKLILVDPKRVELGLYNKIPHLLTPVIVEPEKCISALKWAVAEMENRYKLLAEVGNRNIIEYNKAHPDKAMPYIVIVIDEMADLMVLAAADVESLIVRLAQMARAIGIHLVLATQRPSVDVITGIIKANIPARLAFSVASQVDSRTILDMAGAEKLLGKGDMLFASPEYMKPRRIQGAFLDEPEVKAVTDYLRSVRAPQYDDAILEQAVKLGGGGASGLGEPDDDMFEQAAEACIRSGKASASMLQRRLRVGYARAARLLDLLEERGIIGPPDGARPRDVLVSSMADVTGGPSSGAPTGDDFDDVDE